MSRFAKSTVFMVLLLAFSAAVQAAPISIAAARHLLPGTVVTVEGSVTVRGRGALVLPRFSRIGAIGEATEGLIVVVAGRITSLEDDEPFGQKVFVNDGSGQIRVFINNGANIDVSHLHVGQPVVVTGFSGQFEDYEIDPRFPSDLLAF